jgi:hypothetical protein
MFVSENRVSSHCAVIFPREMVIARALINKHKLVGMIL